MNKKAILFKAALGVYRVKSAESTLPDSIRARLEKTVNKSKIVAAIKGALAGSAIGAGAGAGGSGLMTVGIVGGVEPIVAARNLPATTVGGALWGAPFGGIAGGIRGYLNAAREAEEAQDMLDMDAWSVKKQKKKKSID